MKTNLEECLEKDNIPSDVKEIIKKEIVKRREEETALREREQRYRALFDYNNDAVFIISLDCILLEVNQSAADMLNYSIEELVGMPLSQIVAENEYPDTLSTIKALLEGEKIPTYERTFRRKNGIEFPVEINAALVYNINGTPLHYQAFVRDITERKQAEEALRESEARFRELTERSFDIIAELDLDGCFTYVSSATEKITGYTAEEIVGTSLYDYVLDSESNISEILSGMEQVSKGETIIGLQVEIMRKNGTPAFIEINGSPIIRDKQVIGMQGIAREITNRKQIEEALIQSEERFRRQFKNFPVPAYIWQRANSDFVLIDFNYAAEKITKGEIKSFLNIRASDLYSDRPQILTDMTNCYIGATTIQREQWYKFKSTGEERFFDAHFSFVPPDLLVVYTEDITARQKALIDLSESEKKFRSMISAIPDLIYLTDLEGNILDANPALLEANALSLDEVKGKNVLNFYAGSNPEIIHELASKLKKGQDVKNLQLQTKSYDGVIRHYEIHATPLEGKTTTILSIARDITERRKIERELRKSEQKFRDLVDLLPQTVFEIDLEGTLTFVNQYGLNSFGYTQEEIDKGLNVLQVISSKDRERTKQNVQKVLRGEAFTDHEYFAKRKDGSLFPVLIYSSPIIEGKKLIGLRGILLDITERKKMEDALREKEERLRSIVENSPDFIMRVDRDGKVLFVNYTQPGLTKEDVLGKPVYDFISSEYHDEVKKKLEEVFKSGESTSYEIKGIGPNNSILWYNSRIGAIKSNEDVIAATIIASDVTERKRIEEALRESEERYRLLFEDPKSANMYFDTEGRILLINEYAASLLRGTKEDIIGKLATDILPAESADKYFDKIMLAIDKKRIYEYTDCIDRNEGKRWFFSRIVPILNESGEIIGVQTSTRDITKRKESEEELKKHREHLEEVVRERTNDLRLINKELQQEIAERNQIQQALRESEERFRRLSSVAFEGIIFHDHSKILDANQTLARMLGYDLSEIINKSALDFVAPDYRELVLRNVRRNYEHPYEILALKKDGTTFPVEVTAQRIEYQGQTANVIAIHDISERKKAEDAIEQLRQQKELAERKRLQEQYERRLEEQLQMRQRLDSLGTLVGGIAHDFNNLLAGIMGNLSMLRLELKEEGITTSQKNYLNEAETASRQAAEVIKQFQTLSGGAVSELTSLDLYKIANEVFRFLESTTDRLIEKKIDLKPGKYYIIANPGEMRSVLLNLGTNSVLAIEERGAKPGDFIRITAERYTSRVQDPKGLPEGEYIHILFEDNGCGMSDEVQKRAFDPLFTTRIKGKRKGQGLGLAICYNVVTKSQGYIELESVEGAGTTVHIYLPAADQEVQEKEEEKQLILGHGESVLIVDDEDFVRVLLERLVKRFGYNAMTARDGQEALDIYQAHKDTIDVIILDLIMPKLSGKMLMEKLIEINPEVRVIISSGYSDEKPLDGILANAKAYLTKPYTAEEVVKLIKKVLDL
ncbi:MAG: PAS domain S-box protein [Candidatus Hermodarchaeota archaeon]